MNSDAVTPEILPLTDSGNGTRFAEQNTLGVRYVVGLGEWLVWSDNGWRLDDDGERYRRALATARHIAIECPDTASKGERGAVYQHALRSESADSLERMLRCASREQRLIARPEQLDAEPMLFGCANGAIDLRTGEFRRLSREDLVTRRSPVRYESGALCPTWERFLKRITGENTRLEGFLRRAAGYSLSGDTSEHALFLLYGSGANGKSTLLEVLLHIAGTYGRAAASGLLMARREGRHEEELAELRGVRLATCQESGVDQAFDEARLKQITGGDTISARHLYQRRFDFRPTHKIWVATNHRPRVRGGDEGIWRRLKLIPFEQTIGPEERDPHLREKLLQEATGILAWAVLGCLEWQREGLGVPGEVRDATEDYRAAEDRIGPFLEERCSTGLGKLVVSSRLYEGYREWADAAGDRPLSQQAFTEALKARGLRPTRTKVARMWEGLALRTATGDGVTDRTSDSDNFSSLSLVKSGCTE